MVSKKEREILTIHLLFGFINDYMAVEKNNDNQWIEISGLYAAVINGQTILDPDLQNNLHTQISDLSPAQALMAIARSALMVTVTYRRASPAMAILDQKCRKALRNGVEHYDDLVKMMRCFQTLHELLKINVSFLKAKDEIATKLLRILSVQADAQHAIVEEVCHMHGVGTITEGRAFLPHDIEKTPDEMIIHTS